MILIVVLDSKLMILISVEENTWKHGVNIDHVSDVKEIFYDFSIFCVHKQQAKIIHYLSFI